MPSPRWSTSPPSPGERAGTTRRGALERENFRQLCQEANDWWAGRPEAAASETAAFNRRAELRAAKGNRGSSAA
jgi:hypothetical protein